MKRIIALTLALAMTISNVYAKDITVTLNGKDIEFSNQSPVIVEGRTLIPLRGLFEKLGYTVEWNGDTKTASLSYNNKKIDITAGSSTMIIGKSNTVTLDVPAQIINGSMMLPLRAIGEATGLVVEWDDSSKTVTLSSDNAVIKADDKAAAKTAEYGNKISTDTAEYARANEYIYIVLGAISDISMSVFRNMISYDEENGDNAELFKNMYESSDFNRSIVNNLLPENEYETKIKAAALELIDLHKEQIRILELEDSEGVTEEGAAKMYEDLETKQNKVIVQLDSAMNQYAHIAEGFYLKNFDTGNLEDADAEKLGELIKKLREADEKNLCKISSSATSIEDILNTPLYYARDLYETAAARDEAFAKIKTEPIFAKRIEILYCANDMMKKAADVLEKYSNKKLTYEEAENYLALYCELYDNFNIDGAEGAFKSIMQIIPSVEYDTEDFDLDKA